MKNTSAERITMERAIGANKPIALIGYSGHAYVVIDILLGSGRLVAAYCDREQKLSNPYGLKYLGTENEAVNGLQEFDFFVGIGNNLIRQKVQRYLGPLLGNPVNAIHTSAVVSSSVELATGVMVAANATINPLVKLGHGVICNTACIIDHECIVGDFAHIGPGTVLCGNVKVGAGSFVGASAVIKPGITIGENATIGAGAVIINDVPANCTVVGNPQRILQKGD